MDTSYPAKTQDAAHGSPADDQPVTTEALQAGHETTDVSFKGLVIFGISLLVFLLGMLAIVAGFFQGFDFVNQQLDRKRIRTEPAVASLVQAAPNYQGPLLQVKPEEDLRWMREHNAVDLDGYGWVNRSAGVVRMPIDRAMKRIAERGLPPMSPGKTLEELQRQRAQPQVFGQSLRP